jgi:3,2-trans-enoyl-CoA isomerase
LLTRLLIRYVTSRAVTWCRHLLELPPGAVAATRALARADLVALFDGLDREAVAADLETSWYGEQTQQALAQLARRLSHR